MAATDARLPLNPIDGTEWTGSADECQKLDQFARDYNWEDTPGMIDPLFAADEIVTALAGQYHGCIMSKPAAGRLRSALAASAERENGRRAAND